MWDIEWDFDYGFVLTSTDGGKDFASHAVGQRLHHVEHRPAGRQPQPERLPGGVRQRHHRHVRLLPGRLGGHRPQARQHPRHGVPRRLLRHLRPRRRRRSGAALQLRHRPGPGPARLVHRRREDHRHAARRSPPARSTRTDFETSGTTDDPRVFNGGCRADGPGHVRPGLAVRRGRRRGSLRPRLLPGDARPLRLRPRRQRPGRPRPVAFASGFYTAYTDEAHGYGNAGTDDPPAQSPLDSQPEPGSDTPDLNDAAWTDAADDTHFSDGGDGWTDNYADPSSASGNWEFDYDCLTFDVLDMTRQRRRHRGGRGSAGRRRRPDR